MNDPVIVKNKEKLFHKVTVSSNWQILLSKNITHKFPSLHKGICNCVIIQLYHVRRKFAKSEKSILVIWDKWEIKIICYYY